MNGENFYQNYYQQTQHQQSNVNGYSAENNKNKYWLLSKLKLDRIRNLNLSKIYLILKENSKLVIFIAITSVLAILVISLAASLGHANSKINVLKNEFDNNKGEKGLFLSQFKQNPSFASAIFNGIQASLFNKLPFISTIPTTATVIMTTTISTMTTVITTTQAAIISQSFISSKKTKKRSDCGVIENKFKKRSRIINGKILNTNWPWLVSIHKKDAAGNILGHFCGGTLIATNYIITAAHCFKSFNNTNLIAVIIGLTNQNENQIDSENVFDIEKLIIHELFQFHKTIRNDIALIKLKDGISSSSIASIICLPDNKDDANLVLNKNLFVASYGLIINDKEKIINGKNKHSLVLKQTELKIINGDPVCEKSLIFDSKNLYCALDENRTRSSNLCSGDSGSPLFFNFDSNWYLYGIASFVTAGNKSGTFECITSLPSYFTKVAIYINWIKEKIGSN